MHTLLHTVISSMLVIFDVCKENQVACLQQLVHKSSSESNRENVTDKCNKKSY